MLMTPEKPKTYDELKKVVKEHNIQTIRLQFTDILGGLKNIEIPASQLERALEEGIMFDGSSIQGFTRIEESDMVLKADPTTFTVIPWSPVGHAEARIICDVYTTEGKPFEGCPRNFLRRMIAEAKEMGYSMMAGPEAEFFLFEFDENGLPTIQVHDRGGYFDMQPTDMGENCRRDIMIALHNMGFIVEASHHEVAHGQHEIDFRFDDALTTADNVVTFRYAVKSIAIAHGLHATFMPKPMHGHNGSGMHCHQSLMTGSDNAFFDTNGELQLSDTARHYMGGLIKHARAFTALTNPIVNSYKRLVPGYEAPVYVTWAEKNRSPMIRIPASRGKGTRVEVRSPDPSCNPYIAIGAMLKAGLEGIKNKIEPGAPATSNLYEMTTEERERQGINVLPGTLKEAIDALDADTVMRNALGSHIYENFRAAKLAEWDEYSKIVHQWELDRYLAEY